MIFDLEYDKSLWMMLSVNRNNSEKIISFLESIPNELLVNIREKLNEYKNNKFFNNNNNNNGMYGEVNKEDEYLYFFNIDVVTGELTIGKCIYQYGVYFNDFLLKINVNNDYKLGEISFDYIKEVSDKVLFTSDCTTYVYELVNLFSKKIIVSSNGSKTRFGLANSMPDEYNMNDLNKFVKKKSNIH